MSPEKTAALERCPPCPECQSADTGFTLETQDGSYCRCEACGHVWHYESAKAVRQ